MAGSQKQTLEDKLQKSGSKALSFKRRLVISLDVDQLTVDDHDTIKDIFLQLFASKDNLDLTLTKESFRSKINIKLSSEDKLDDLLKKINNNDRWFIDSPILFRAVISAAKESKIHLDLSDFVSRLEILLHPPYDKALKEEDILSLLKILHENGMNNEKLDTLYNYFIYHLILSDKESTLINALQGGEPEFINMLTRFDGKPLFFLHKLLTDGHAKKFEKVLSYLHDQPIHDLDKNNNNFLHVTKANAECLELAFQYTKNINQKNNKGHTPLHDAAALDDFRKAYFLLTHGADPAIKNNTQENFWEVDSGTDISLQKTQLNLFRKYKQFGNALNIPPEIVEQKGLNCGFYAIACAANFLRTQHPTFFQSSNPVYARKKDISPKADVSLREKRKGLGIPGHGAIFSAKELAKVADAAECETLILDVGTKEEFLVIIKKATELNFPIIIPFSASSTNTGHPAEKPTGETAHWATVIGYAPREGEVKGILLAQYGTYFDTDANQLYDAFNEIPDTFPKTYMYKNVEWNLSDHNNHPGSKVEEIPLTDLSDFRRKLVVVLPPNADAALLMTQISSPSPT